MEGTRSLAVIYSSAGAGVFVACGHAALLLLLLLFGCLSMELERGFSFHAALASAYMQPDKAFFLGSPVMGARGHHEHTR